MNHRTKQVLTKRIREWERTALAGDKRAVQALAALHVMLRRESLNVA